MSSLTSRLGILSGTPEEAGPRTWQEEVRASQDSYWVGRGEPQGPGPTEENPHSALAGAIRTTDGLS